MTKKKYFGTDGIRGRANRFPMTAEIALKVAMATAHVLQKRQDISKQTNRVVIGKDTRLSGYMFEDAMCSGFVSMGLNVIQVGPIPTPGIAMLTRNMRADVGVMISASHNKFEDNGIKLFGPDGYKLDDEIEREIEALIAQSFDDKLAPPDKCGKASRLDDALGRYVEHVKSSFPKGESLEGMKIVVDCANGAAYKVAPQVLWELEAEVKSIGVSPNGRNINAGVGATDVAALQAHVLAEGADIGIALDGDADRLIVVDEKGQKIDGDQIMAALALRLNARGALAGDTLVATVMSNLGMEQFLAKNGIKTLRTQVGDRYVMEAMRADGYVLGGEQSGHMIMSEYGTTGDGLLAALQILAALQESGKPASEALHMFDPLPQLLKNVRISPDAAPMDDPAVIKAIDNAQTALDGQGRVLVRASGTEPLIRVMAEGQDRDQIETHVDALCAIIEKSANGAS
ncbi:MAG: phosphoglucosamine mutase [Alphaproteobacteria bacterium]|nr:phosphoglucosamine mutase [Alphaproteobacteria bacterium]|tara:strand:- start:25967 stop:27340 length:1374 start_codon:yes stop_codon:yes gene_type:complete